MGTEKAEQGIPGEADKQLAPNKKQSSANKTLPLISKPIGNYSVDELNAALITTFGEISPLIHPKLQEEANAVASTIFNRLDKIENARNENKKNQQQLDPTKKARDDATKNYEELVNHPPKYKHSLGGTDQYNKAVDTAKTFYNTATKSLGSAQTAFNQANSVKISAETYVDPSKRNNPNLTLADIVEPDDQYKGTKKGKADFNHFPSMRGDVQQRNLKRWNIAKNAVETLAKEPKSRDKYIEFRSNGSGHRTLQEGETRIGGNDFW